MWKRSQLFAGCHLATHPKSRSSRSRRICLQVILLFVLESSQDPSRLCPDEVALLVGFSGMYPSTCYVILRFDLPHVNEVKNLIVNPGFPLEVFRSSKLLVVSWADASFRARDRIFGSCSCGFSTGGHATFQHVSRLIVNSVWSSTRVLLESSVTSSRHSDRCTLGKEVNLYLSWCSPFAVVTKHNDPAAAAYLRVPGVTGPMFIVHQDAEIWVKHGPSKVLTSCTVLVAILTFFVIRIGAGSLSL